MQNYTDTIISQYANSPIIGEIISGFNDAVDPSDDFLRFIDFVWNINTAQGWGLDILGRIVGVGRVLQIPLVERYFGFEVNTIATDWAGEADWDGAADWDGSIPRPFYPFNDAPFYNGHSATQAYELSDQYYRKLVRGKAFANISGTTVPAMNALLGIVFAGRGRCYIVEGTRELTYHFDFTLDHFELAMVTSSGVFVHPTGVQVSIEQP